MQKIGWVIMYANSDGDYFPWIEKIFTDLKQAQDMLKKIKEKEDKNEKFWIEEVLIKN